MTSETIKKQIKDEIKEPCVQCGKTTLVAYWDYELEYYIYLSDSPVCTECETVVSESCELA